MNQTSKKLLEINQISKTFGAPASFWSTPTPGVKAVRAVSLTLRSGETLGLVGESGCGKSTLARCILRLIEPDSGEIWFQGENLRGLTLAQLRPRRRHMQMIFQDPYSSLNPRMTVGQILTEPLKIHNIVSAGERGEAVAKLLVAVGLLPEMARRYPHEFSGGQRQRIGIARALALNPQLIVADEPVSALDVSVQAQILNVLQDLQREKHLAYLLIAHDLKVVERLSNRIAVMYLGEIVEEGRAADVVREPLHPYTQALLSAVPEIRSQSSGKKRIVLTGDVPSPKNPPTGCHFHPRCPLVKARCKEQAPPLEIKKDQRKVACWEV